jgi:hypothetical protein
LEVQPDWVTTASNGVLHLELQIPRGIVVLLHAIIQIQVTSTFDGMTT